MMSWAVLQHRRTGETARDNEQKKPVFVQAEVFDEIAGQFYGHAALHKGSSVFTHALCP